MAGTPAHSRVGRIGRPHGLRGEVTVLPDTDDPGRFDAGSHLVTAGGRELIVRSAAPYRDKGLIVGFDGVTTRTQAETLRGEILLADPSTRRELDDGEFWDDDLAGLRAVAPSGEELGIVSSVEHGPGQDRLLVVTPEGREVQVPFVDDLVGDPEGGTIEIRDPGGLFTTDG